MPLSGLAFLIDITVEELKSVVPTKQFVIKSQFADIFSLVLKNPGPSERKRKRKKSRNKTKVKHVKNTNNSTDLKKKPQNSQNLLYVGNSDILMSHMMQYPIEICLCSQFDPEGRIGSTLIPWNPAFIDYMVSLYYGLKPNPVSVRDVHNIFDEATSKRMATINLTIKLRTTDHINFKRYRVLSNKYQDTFIMMDLDQLYIDQSTNTLDDEGPGIIKTIYAGGKQKKRSSTKTRNAKREAHIAKLSEERDKQESRYKQELAKIKQAVMNSINRKLLLHLTRTETDVSKPVKLDLLSSKSCASMKRINLLDYVFSNDTGPFGNKVYTVGYVTVNDPKDKTPSGTSATPHASSKTSDKSVDKTPSKASDKTPSKVSDKTPSKVSDKTPSKVSDKTPSKVSDKTPSKTSNKTDKSSEKPTDKGPSKTPDDPSKKKESPDKKTKAPNIILTKTVKCDNVRCLFKREQPLLEKPDDRIFLDITSLQQSCCVTKVKNKTETEPDCYCACECTFGFERKTTYCRICKGYERLGVDLDGTPQYLMPDPCPIFHKISRIKTGSTSGSDTKKETKRKKQKEPKKDGDDRFKFNYGYKAPQIGHSRCVLPCTGTMSNVPKSMGWLWTADNIPGLPFRPAWKPGAINKVVGRKLRNALYPDEKLNKRKKPPPYKKPLKRPLLVVHKKDGEFTVTMETMKNYSKQRTLNQQPYEDKPVLTYTIGRTELENQERQKKRERAARRLEREQREFIQSAFTDMCKEICIKTYQQALGILPDAEDPECTCYPALPDPNRVNEEHSCSCSDDNKESFDSETDDDEWILEFTPPTACFDPTYPGIKTKFADNETQYTYLDYRVKLVDRFGNPVPRFFKGPDGAQQCSDLGGFWSADNNWLQINVDGYIAPDGRWAPIQFIGPSGEQVETNLTGKFQDSKGNWLVVGIDGYVDCKNKWKYYRRPVNKQQGPKQRATAKSPLKKGQEPKAKPVKKEESLPTFSCFGDATPVDLSRMGIIGHGPDKRLLNKMLTDLMEQGIKVEIPQASSVPKSPLPAQARERIKAARTSMERERSVCRHPKPSLKGVIRKPDGSESYYRSPNFVNRSTQERLYDLEKQGRSLSAFHEPCFHSNLDCKEKHRQGRRVVVTMPHTPIRL